MKFITKLFFGLLFSVASLYGALEATQLKCEVDVEDLGLEPLRQTNTLYSYDVNASCVFTYNHHDGNGRSEDFNEKLGPYVVSKLPPEGRVQAFIKAYYSVYRKAYEKLREDCKNNGCDCVLHGCSCLGCKPAPLRLRARNNIAIEDEKQVDEDAAALVKPIILKKIKNIGGIKTAQKEYLYKHYKDEMLHGIINMYTMYDSRYIHIAAIQDEAGQVKLVFFDMTDIYNKIGKRGDKFERLKVKELMARHKSVKKQGDLVNE